MSRLIQVFRSLGGALRAARPCTDAPPERRQLSRVSKCLPVEVEGRSLTSTNVAESGLQVQVGCPESWLRSLQETWDRNATKVCIQLPDGYVLAVECSVVYVSDCDDEYLIGLKFNNSADADHEPWQSYLAMLHGTSGVRAAANAA